MENIQLSLFGRTSQGLSVLTGEKTSKWYLKALSEYPNQKPPRCLTLTTATTGQKQTLLWATNGALATELSTRNTGEFPSVGEECTLSQILEDNAPEKYYLSATACEGILRRSSQRGKKLPELLETALKEQVTRSKFGGSERDAAGRKAGKGALIQEEKSATLATSNDQTLFVPVDKNILDDKGGDYINVRDDGKAPTLRAETHGHPPCVISLDTFHCSYETEKVTTLKARDYKDPQVIAVKKQNG